MIKELRSVWCIFHYKVGSNLRDKVDTYAAAKVAGLAISSTRLPADSAVLVVFGSGLQFDFRPVNIDSLIRRLDLSVGGGAGGVGLICGGGAVCADSIGVVGVGRVGRKGAYVCPGFAGG